MAQTWPGEGVCGVSSSSGIAASAVHAGAAPGPGTVVEVAPLDEGSEPAVESAGALDEETAEGLASDEVAATNHVGFQLVSPQHASPVQPR
jgi:hypothetical protein